MENYSPITIVKSQRAVPDGNRSPKRINNTYKNGIVPLSPAMKIKTSSPKLPLKHINQTQNTPLYRPFGIGARRFPKRNVRYATPGVGAYDLRNNSPLQDKNTSKQQLIIRASRSESPRIIQGISKNINTKAQGIFVQSSYQNALNNILKETQKKYIEQKDNGSIQFQKNKAVIEMLQEEMQHYGGNRFYRFDKPYAIPKKFIVPREQKSPGPGQYVLRTDSSWSSTQQTYRNKNICKTSFSSKSNRFNYHQHSPGAHTHSESSVVSDVDQQKSQYIRLMNNKINPGMTLPRQISTERALNSKGGGSSTSTTLHKFMETVEERQQRILSNQRHSTQKVQDKYNIARVYKGSSPYNQIKTRHNLQLIERERNSVQYTDRMTQDGAQYQQPPSEERQQRTSRFVSHRSQNFSTNRFDSNHKSLSRSPQAIAPSSVKSQLRRAAAQTASQQKSISQMSQPSLREVQQHIKEIFQTIQKPPK